MTALARMRLVGYVRTGRVVAPLVTYLVVLGTLYGGGAAQAGEAYGVSALFLFPVLAWQTKLLLDAEPDVQRRLAVVAVGSPLREQAAGLFAAVAAALPVVVISLVLPWGLGGISASAGPGDPSLLSGVSVGLWAHLVMIAPAVALGACASRAVTGSFGMGAMVVVAGAVLTLVLGLNGSPVWWLAPPMMSVARLATHGFVPSGVAALTVHALAWTAVALAGYVGMRRSRT
ncbi:hypothetical protein [Planosporangium mesophilum]|uniref:ABC transporter n=1 Tax=Planosporangium mesophilum TaxID=689768 RepID=A0A8J3TMZ3_9ACTN|nr:hypothetical protein [Planosporangium mesophilum]NJC84711.1 hypothetical protein [Planosporangium mesophilum]GII24270.1 hypothetical protein Pme01_38670 [Planosporangium mesophilum]